MKLLYLSAAMFLALGCGAVTMDPPPAPPPDACDVLSAVGLSEASLLAAIREDRANGVTRAEILATIDFQCSQAAIVLIDDCFICTTELVNRVYR